jgi:3D-(3,5/4)-trihydroxycyclohexane-1,2-dione acylhydrolase (decyclizing)
MVELIDERTAHASAIFKAGSLQAAMENHSLPRYLDTTVSETLILGLLAQNVSKFFTVLGHGSTEIGEILRIYQEFGLVKVMGVHNEIEASHAATALRWITGEKAAVVTSIGPGALQALAASLVPASDGIGIWYIFGDETTEDEGYNMQQIPKPEQDLFLQLMKTMGKAYTLHTPTSISVALEKGLVATTHPHHASPFYLLLPMNVQPIRLPGFNMREIPTGEIPPMGTAEGDYEKAVNWIQEAGKIVVKIGGGARKAGAELARLLELVDGVAVWTPIASGTVPYSNPRNMIVGGSKGTLCGNFAMEEADLLIAVGTRAVCQSDCSRTGYPHVERVININTDYEDALHYRKTLALVGDAVRTIAQLNQLLDVAQDKRDRKSTTWLAECSKKRQEWEVFKQKRFDTVSLHDDFWGREVLTQPAVIKTATDWARANQAISIFDAGDVQANGFQIIEDERIGQTYTETGASYMGFACSALLASAMAHKPFYAVALTGDGSFIMNPQVLIDGAEYGAQGCILLLDNNRMAAISGLQKAQYNHDFATHHVKPIDYLVWASSVPNVLALECKPTIRGLQEALDRARAHKGLSLIHAPVYYGDNELGGMGVFGRWNVGNWSEQTQALRHQIGL